MRGDGVVEDVDGDWPPKDERVVGDDDDDDFPLRGGSPPRGIVPPEGKSAPAQVLPRRQCSIPKVLPLFSLGQNDLYTRTWAPEVGLGEHNPPGRAQVACAHLVGPLWYLFSPIILIYSIKNPREVLAHLKL